MKITRSLKGTIFALGMMALSHVQAANEIYIEQVGDDATVTLKQAGSNNTIGDALAPAFIGGGQNVVFIEQSGSSNQLAMLVNGAGTNVTSVVTGDSNQQTITCGTSISASCSGSAITHTITGDNNDVKSLLGANGGAHTSNITVLGDYNHVTHNSSGSGANSATINVTGSGSSGIPNAISVSQSGINTHSATVNASGNNLNISIIQSD
jgi:GGDEF domain-containing protein